MGLLEHRCFYLHQMCWNTSKSWGPYIKGQVCQLGPMDTRANTGKISENIFSLEGMPEVLLKGFEFIMMPQLKHFTIKVVLNVLYFYCNEFKF